MTKLPPAEYKTEGESRYIRRTLSNVETDLIEITDDKLHRILLEHENTRRHVDDWKASTGIFLTILAALTTSDFKDAFSLSAIEWNTIFHVFGLITAIWTIISFHTRWKHRKAMTIDNLVTKIKKAAPRQ